MTKEKEIEEEVQRQVLFKMKQLKTVLLNHSRWNKAKAYNMGLSVKEIREYSMSSVAKKELSEIIDKEMYMGVPDLNEIEEKEQRKIKDDKIDNFMKHYGNNFRGRSPGLEQSILQWLVKNL